MTQGEDRGGLQASGVRVDDACAGDDGARATVNSLANAFEFSLLIPCKYEHLHPSPFYQQTAALTRLPLIITGLHPKSHEVMLHMSDGKHSRQ